MLRGFVTLFVSLQLLMPSGMCICQFAPVANAFIVASLRSGENANHHVSVAQNNCRCPVCLGDESSERVSTSTSPTSKSSQESPFIPRPAKHYPGCPAELGDMPTKIAVPTVTLEFDDFEPVRVLDWSIGSLHTSPKKYRLAFTLHSPPFFISDCTLLI